MIRIKSQRRLSENNTCVKKHYVMHQIVYKNGIKKKRNCGTKRKG